MISTAIKYAFLAISILFVGNVFAFGKVEATIGKVTLIDLDGQSSALVEGSKIKAGETILTEISGEVLIKTDDDGVILLKSDSKFKIEAYTAKGNEKDAFVAKLIKGSLRSLTGFIGKTAPKRYKVSTSTATIGIRGTDYELQVVEDSKADLVAGTFAKVNVGEISMTSRGINLNLSAKQYGLATSRALPQLLDTPPDELFKPSALDSQTQLLIQKISDNELTDKTLQNNQQIQKNGGGYASSGEPRIPTNCAGNNPAQQSLDEFIRAYERGDIAYIQRRLDPSMIGYNVFLNSMIDDAIAQKQIRFLIQNRNAQCGSDLAVINFRWEKRFIDLVSFKPRLQVGQASVLTYLKAGEWKLSGITGDNPFASSLNESSVSLAINPVQIRLTSLPTTSTPNPTSTFIGTGTASVNQPLLASPTNTPPTCNLSSVPSCNIGGQIATVVADTLTCSGTSVISVVYNAVGSVPFSSTGPSSSTALVTQVIPVSGNSGVGETVNGTITCQANINYPAGAPILSVAATSVSAQIQVINSNQAGVGIIQIQALASNGDSEILTLNETSRGTFIRTGFNVAGGAVVPNNGVISINGATTITLRHTDPKTGKLTNSVFRITP